MNTTTNAPAIPVQKPAERPEVAVLIPDAIAALRARQLNTVEKRDGHRSVLDRLNRDYQSDAVIRQAHNNKVWADLAALDQTAKECDLSPERADSLRARVADRLPRYFDYVAAVGIIKDFESNYEEVPPSHLNDSIKNAAKERMEDLSDTLSYAMNAEQVAFVESLTNRGYLTRRLWSVCLPERSILSIPLKAPYVRFEFGKLVERCRTQRELKLLAECYGLEAKVSRGSPHPLAEPTRIQIGTATIIAL